MRHNGPEILHADSNMYVLVCMKVFKVFDMDGDGRLERLLENLFTIHDFLCETREYRLAVLGQNV